MSFFKWLSDLLESEPPPNYVIEKNWKALSSDEIIKKANEAIRKVVAVCLREHGEILLRKKCNLQYKDEYGVTIDNGWLRELEHYYRNVVAPKLNPELDSQKLSSYISIYRINLERTVIDHLNAILRDFQSASTNTITHVVPTNPYEYEGFCRRLLEASGWQATGTPASGDQGADVIARKSACILVLQCKLWSSPVGNKAVQEIVAAKSFYGANAAAVVTNQSYTESAKALAAKNGVLLLHHNDLSRLEVS